MRIYLLPLLFLWGMTSNAQQSEEVGLETASGVINGTITMPEAGAPAPVVLIISGSGPTDRDGNSYYVKNDALKLLADSLTLRGIATLRYDKRGVAASVEVGPAEKDLRFETYIEDAVGWIKLLKQQQKKGIFSQIFILGHSEGALIANLAGIEEKVAGFISLAGPGRRADVLLKEQLGKNTYYGSPLVLEMAEPIIDSLVAGYEVKKVDLSLGKLFRPSVQPYLISWFKYDPKEAISKLDVPVLIIQGSTDLQVTEEDAELLARAQPEGQLAIIDEMNHVLRKVSEDPKENLGSYSRQDLPLHPGLIPVLVDFIQE